MGNIFFRAYKLMREGVLLGGLLTNAESWLNLTQKNVEELEKPDLILQRKVLSTKGNPSKVFMMLELGIVPIRFVLMKKRMQFLHYLLNEDQESMIRRVFETLKADSQKGDFIFQTNSDKIALNIDFSDE